MRSLASRNYEAELVTLSPYPLSDEMFLWVQKTIYDKAGISLSQKKKQMVQGRLSRRLRCLNLQTFEQYRDLLCSAQYPDEFTEFINALTTNKTSFYREPHHFHYLQQRLLPQWFASSRPVTIWSSACSTGQEPYTIAMVIKAYRQQIGRKGPEIRILATDLDTQVLDRAQTAVYELDSVSELGSNQLKNGFLRGVGDNHNKVRVQDEVRRLVQFQQMNLNSLWKFAHQFDLIFCRNVMIYFDGPTQQRLLQRFHKQLKNDGTLILGHSETLGRCETDYRSLGKTIFCKR